MSYPASEFFNELFQEMPAEARLLVWTLESKQSFWASTPEDAARHSHAKRLASDVYFGVGLAPAGLRENMRCTAEGVLGIPGLWTDLDYGRKGHEKANLPPTEEDALMLLDRLDMPPTLIVHSGHGLQPYWLFKEPWLFADVEDRRRAAQMVQGWNDRIRAVAAGFGWDYDHAHDLARVLRVPGTLNRKAVPFVEAGILSTGGPRWNPTDFDDWIRTAAPRTVVSVSFALNPTANPPFEKFMQLTAAEPRFKASWEHARKDLQDQSFSSYDQSLADFAINHGWSDQEAADLLIAHRRKYGQDPKLREDYYRGTLSKARMAKTRTLALTTITALYDQEKGREGRAKPPKDELLRHVSALLEIEIRGVIRYTSGKACYRLETPQDSLVLGPVGELIHQERLRTHLAELAAHYMPGFKADKWRSIAQCLLDLCEDDDIGPDATARGIVRGWLEGYLKHKEPGPRTEAAVKEQAPFTWEGKTYVFLPRLREWIGRATGEFIGPKELGVTLREAGSEYETMNLILDGKTTTRAVWCVPLWEGEEPS